jgi:hypothetical protein
MIKVGTKLAETHVSIISLESILHFPFPYSAISSGVGFNGGNLVYEFVDLKLLVENKSQADVAANK